MKMALPQSEMDEVFGHLRSIVGTRDARTTKAHEAAQAIRDARAYHWVGLYDVTSTEIVAVAWSGAEAPAFTRFPVEQGLNGAAVRLGQPVVVQDVRADSRYLTTFGTTRAEAIFPIKSPSTGKVLGTIDAESDRTESFTPEEQAFLSVTAPFPLSLGAHAAQQTAAADRPPLGGARGGLPAGRPVGWLTRGRPSVDNQVQHGPAGS